MFGCLVLLGAAAFVALAQAVPGNHRVERAAQHHDEYGFDHYHHHPSHYHHPPPEVDYSHPPPHYHLPPPHHHHGPPPHYGGHEGGHYGGYEGGGYGGYEGGYGKPPQKYGSKGGSGGGSKAQGGTKNPSMNQPGTMDQEDPLLSQNQPEDGSANNGGLEGGDLGGVEGGDFGRPSQNNYPGRGGSNSQTLSQSQGSAQNPSIDTRDQGSLSQSQGGSSISEDDLRGFKK